MTHNKSAKTLKREKKSHRVNLTTIRKWHWMSSAICFVCMLLFSVTGITLNHAGNIESKPRVDKVSGKLPAPLLQEIRLAPGQKTFELSASLIDWFKQEKHIVFVSNIAEVNDGEIYLALPRPGGDAWLSIGESGEFEYESTDRGWISYFNDIHKGRNTGKAWIYFMDLFAIACVVFSITGFMLLQRYADTRSQTWPLLGAGLLVPVFFMLFLIHS